MRRRGNDSAQNLQNLRDTLNHFTFTKEVFAVIITHGDEVIAIDTAGSPYPRLKSYLEDHKEKEVLSMVRECLNCILIA